MTVGKVITFYSYKGGTGRSMALANIAWVLALNGKKVLTIDWDLEAPGLHRYFLPFLNDPELSETPGLIELLWNYTDIVLTPRESWLPGIEDPLALADAQRYAVPLEFPFSDSKACIHFLGAGRQDAAYASQIRSFDWHAFYERLGGSQFIENLRERSIKQYDFVLIDSRTGVADTSGICTVQLPDAVVLCFTYNRQSMIGIEAVAKSIKAQGRGRIKLLPIAMRADRAVKGYDQAKQVARELFEPLLTAQFDNELLDRYWEACEVPYYPDYAFEETLSIFRDLPGQRNTFLNDMVWLAETLEGNATGSLTIPDLGGAVREKYLRRFALRDPRLSQLAEILELPPSEAYSRLSSLATLSEDDSDDQAWILALAKALDSLTDRMRNQGLIEQALAVTRESIGILKKISEQNNLAQRLLADNLNKLASQLEALGRNQEAVVAINEAIEYYRLLTQRVPKLVPNLVSALSKRGTLLSGLGQWAEALDVTIETVDEYEKLALGNPEMFDSDLANCLSHLGIVYKALGQQSKANEAILRATSIYEHLAQSNPEAFELDFARSLNNLGNSYNEIGQPEEGLYAVLRAAVIYERIAQKTPAIFESQLGMGLIGSRGKYRELDISGKQLATLPENLGQLDQLQRLNVSDNKLSTLPEIICKLEHLQYLDVSGNKLSTLPTSLGQLTQLQYLNASGNNLAGLPETIGELYQLQSLYLSNSKLSSLPRSLGHLHQLRVLDLSANKLTSLPESLGQLYQLRTLDLSANKLSSLPKFLGQLIQLQYLGLARNGLTSLPDSIDRLNQLRTLDLSANELSSLPSSLRNLYLLEQLYLHRNDALSLPTEVLGATSYNVFRQKVKPASPVEILEYYFRVRGGKRPLNEAKLILVGRGGVGKTSLVNRLVHGLFRDEKKTEGIKITDWAWKLKEKEDVRLHVWDFGGQEIMHATHQFFLTERSLYLLVLNGREGGEDADAEYWLKLIESFGGESPVIIVLNKIKERPFDVNRRALRQKYPFVRDFIKTDCEDGTGIEKLRQAIERETDELEHLRDAFPASWFSIKDKLAGMGKNFLGFDDYREVCEQLGEKDEKAQEMLASYLHSLGIALNYRDDPRLQDTHVLNPRWVTNGIYKILNSQKLKEQNGEIWLKDLDKILGKRDYPAKMHRFLFDLLKKFDLCFSFPDDELHYLIPELLDKQEPEEAADFDPPECLNFQYHYPVLPEGLLPRFIVRTHILSEGRPRWRTGVILNFEGNLALVKGDVQDKKVFISVSGPAAGRRRLLAVIRSEFERLHRDIRNLQPQQMVPVPHYPNVAVSYEKLLEMDRRGIRQLLEIAGNDVIELDVQELLNGVDLEGTRKRERAIEEGRQPVRLFCSYSHRDENLRNELETHLKLLQRRGLIDAWHDRKIEAGDDWKKKIDENLERANIILLLVSSDFIASDYCYEKEMMRALERQREGEARVLPVIIRDVNLQGAPFIGLQYLPKDGRPVTQWPTKDSAWRNVSEGIEKVVEDLRKQ